jgi:hypothetical protein
MLSAKRKPTNCLSISRTDGCQWMKKSVPDDLWPESWPKMWQKFDTEGIVHKKFVPPGHTVNGKFYCEDLRRMRSKHPDEWCNNSWAQYHENALAYASLVVLQFLASTKMTIIPHPPTHWISPPLILSYSWRPYWSWKGEVLTAPKRSRPNRRMWWWHRHKMTSSSASDHENPARIAVSVQKGATS